MHPLLACIDALAQSLGGTVVEPDDMIDGDLPLECEGRLIGGFRQGGIHDALDRLIEQVERELGEPIEGLDRAGKQAVVRRLDHLGAFGLRKAVEDIADRLGVSRFTVYNYLNSQHESPGAPHE